MIEKLVEKLIDLGKDSGIAFLQDNMKDAISRKKCVDAVVIYLERQHKYNGLNTLAEEYDFEGFCDYFKNNLIDKVNVAISGTESERKSARRDLYNAAYNMAGAQTKESMSSVKRLVSDAIDILRCIAKKKIAFEDKVLAAEIEDTINEHTSSIVSAAVTDIRDAVREVSNFSLNNIIQLKNTKDSEGIELLSQTFNNAIAGTHRLFPYYRAIPSERYNGQLISVPANDEALSKMPPKFVFKGIAKMGNEVLVTLTPEDIDYADRHQIPITLTVLEAKKFLGEFEDPYQHEAEGMKGREFVRQPKEFESAQPYSIKINGETLYEYLELGLIEILDDGVLVVTNDKQENRAIKVRLELNFETHKVDISVKIENKTNSNSLQFTKLMKAAIEGSDISVFSLKLEKDLVRGIFGNCSYTTGFDDINEEIDFIERVCDMEKYFKKEINVPYEISERDYKTVQYISDMIRGEITELEANKFKANGIVDANLRKRILDMEDAISEYAFVGTAQTSFWGITFEYPLLRTIKNARISNLDKVKKLVELLDDGENIPVTIISSEECCYDQFAPDELMEKSLQMLEDKVKE